MTSESAKEAAVRIELTNEEALVLFDCLSRMNDEKELRFEHQAEQRVLWDIECVLEAKLVGPFKSNYDELLQKAREAVADPELFE